MNSPPSNKQDGLAARELERAEFASVLRSALFQRSPKLSRLLSYLCEKHFRGEAGQITEYGIAVDVLERDADFNPQVDRETGYRTHSLLCMPILDRNKRVFAVVQMLNKHGNEPFSEEDEKSFREFTDPLGVILESCARMNEGQQNPESTL